MAENLETPQMGNFSIQDTMEMGMGNTELLNDLFAPETSTSSPDDIKEIKEEAPAPKKSTKAPIAEEEAPETKPKEDSAQSIQDFLLGGDDDDEEEEAPAPKAKKQEAAPAAEESTSDDAEDTEEQEEVREERISDIEYEIEEIKDNPDGEPD